MNPVQEHSLRRWLAFVLAKEEQSLRKTPEHHPKFGQYGRWSRWFYDKWAKKQVLMERDVDLEDLASRCRAYLNSQDWGLR